MDDDTALPKPPAETIELLRRAEEVTTSETARAQFRALREALTGPTMLSAREVVARVSQAIPSGSAAGTTTRTGTAYGVSGTPVAAVTGSSGSVELIRANSESTDYAKRLALRAGFYYIIAEIIDKASETLIRWLEFHGH